MKLRSSTKDCYTKKQEVKIPTDIFNGYISVDGLSFCCGVGEIGDFPSYIKKKPKPASHFYRKCIDFYSEREIKKDLIQRIHNVINNSKFSYYIATLNRIQIEEGIEDILLNDIGFHLLDDGFVNKTGSDIVRLYGLCATSYQIER